MENDGIVTDPSKCTEIFNNYFIESVSNLDIYRNLNIGHSLIIDNLVEKAVEMLKNLIVNNNPNRFLDRQVLFSTRF